MRIGKVVEVWRYPVKSMAGERLDAAVVGADGVAGDRGWALRDEAAGEVRGAKNFPQLMLCAARYVEEPASGRIPAAEIRLPDGERVRSDEPHAAERLSLLLGRPVTVHPRRPAEEREHYRRRLPSDPGQLEAELRRMFGRLPEEPLPDLSVFPRELVEFVAPLGTYFDALPIHLLTTATLAQLSLSNPSARFDRRRFRPNFLVELDERSPGFHELGWSGREAKIGGVRAKIEMPVVRCSMTIQPQDDLPKDPSILRTIVREADQNVGVYATVTSPGEVRAGDALEIV